MKSGRCTRSIGIVQIPSPSCSDASITGSRLLGYGALIIQWKLDRSVQSAPNPTYILIEIDASPGQ